MGTTRIASWTIRSEQSVPRERKQVIILLWRMRQPFRQVSAFLWLFFFSIFWYIFEDKSDSVGQFDHWNWSDTFYIIFCQFVLNLKKKFPLDWTQCVDKNTGHPYYWNIETKEVTWEIPDEYQRFLELSAANFAKTSTFSKWVHCNSDDQQPYYFNEVTREISWERPADYVDVVPEVSHSGSSSSTTKTRAKETQNERPTKKTFKKYPFPELEDE